MHKHTDIGKKVSSEGEEMKPRGIRNCNPGNIKKSTISWLGKIDQTDDIVFEKFEGMEYGIRALLIILRSYITKHKLTTIEGIIKRFAPSSENDTKAYIKTVSDKTGFAPDMTLEFTPEDIIPLASAICFVENGGFYISNEQIEKAWEMI